MIDNMIANIRWMDLVNQKEKEYYLEDDGKSVSGILPCKPSLLAATDKWLYLV